MRRFVKWSVFWLFLFGLVWSIELLAADGDNLSGGCDDSGGTYICEAFLLCDAKASSVAQCTEFDLNLTGRGYPEFYTVTLSKETGCTAGGPELTLRGTHVSGECGATPTTACVDLRGSPLQTDVIQGDTFDVEYRYIDAETGGTLTSCTDIEVSLVLYWRRP